MRNNNYGSWSGGAPGEDILNDPRYWGLDVDGPEPPEDEDDEEEEEDEGSDTRLGAVELGRQNESYVIEKHRLLMWQGKAIGPAYLLVDTDKERWIFGTFNEVMRDLFRDFTLDLSPAEYAALYALREVK